jgi:uncharacterized protein YigE (DUF2233 family)
MNTVQKLHALKIGIFILALVFLVTVGFVNISEDKASDDERFVTFIVNPKIKDVSLYWKDEHQQNFKNIQNLKSWIEKQNRQLEFAMNGGMYKKDNSPQGLYIEKQQTLSALDTGNGGGNFYLKPNGVFYLNTKNTPAICTTEKFKDDGAIKYATQSGPMLVSDGEIHSAFKKGSQNLNIRNGVGILPDNTIIFAMSKSPINFYDFAEYFKSLGCRNALYLDGLVSRTYLPNKNWRQLDGNFGVIIGVTIPPK